MPVRLQRLFVDSGLESLSSISQARATLPRLWSAGSRRHIKKELVQLPQWGVLAGKRVQPRDVQIQHVGRAVSYGM